ARTLPPNPPARTLVLAAFTNEEPPFFGGDEMGSAHYARRLVDAKTPVDLMIALDLVGSFDDTPGSQGDPLSWMKLVYPSRGNFIAVVGDTGAGAAIKKVKRGMLSARTIPVESFRSPNAIGGVDWSDHIWFRRLGMPAIMVTDTAFLRMPHYHRTTDTPEKLDYDRMAAVTQALHGVLALEAGRPRGRQALTARRFAVLREIPSGPGRCLLWTVPHRPRRFPHLSGANTRKSQVPPTRHPTCSVPRMNGKERLTWPLFSRKSRCRSSRKT